jgi:hypothetical protein
MDDDDAPVGRILSRRENLALLGGPGAALLAACARRDRRRVDVGVAS